ncbi:protein-tyrosine phosphatase-like protein [Cunninghamella echinulata]|nr:protein-tyrosine phosphatase-like protein [Cunninghamella echinulata]
MSFIPKQVAKEGLDTLQYFNQGSKEVLYEHAKKQFKLLNDRQYKRLRQSDNPKLQYSQVIAKREHNESRNRYIDIIPYDYNRIKLNNRHLGPCQYNEEDYINASLIEFDLDGNNNIESFSQQQQNNHNKEEDGKGHRKRRYIATQGPLPSTIGDFWRMILEQQVKVIVCLTPEKENGRNKCARYWPVGNDEVLTYNLTSLYQPSSTNTTTMATKRRTSLISSHFLLPSRFKQNNMSEKEKVETEKEKEEIWTIQVKNEQPEVYDERSATIIRCIRVTCSYQDSIVQSSLVYQLQFLGWIDHGVPNQTNHVNALIQLTNHLQANSDFNKDDRSASPIVVHCSAGCGRTGTFCVIDSCTHWLKDSYLSSSSSATSSLSSLSIDPVFELADLFRKQRTTMVQAPSQFLFCYQAIWDMLQELKGDE